MDNVGWHAFRRAQHEEELYSRPQRGQDGRYAPVEEITPMSDQWIGGFHPNQQRPQGAPPLPPRLPPRQSRPPPYEGASSSATMSPAQVARLDAVERTRIQRIARMDPYLQFMVGPLLRYDTVDEQGIWHGAAMIVTSDAGSIYEPFPVLTYEWDSRGSPKDKNPSRASTRNNSAFVLGPHPADPLHVSAAPVETPLAEATYSDSSPGQEIWVYGGRAGTFTFWRFMIHIPLGQSEMPVWYSINGGQKMQFFVPGRTQNFRWAAHSCNGFSAGVNPDDFRGPGFASGYDPVWIDLLAKHAEQPFHVLVGGGDQLYCDRVTREPELQDWVSSNPDKRQTFRLTEEMLEAIDRFYFNHYCQAFRTGAFARANSSIPMLNMADDHDLIDGFGSYPDELMLSPVFRTIGTRGYWFFLLFQTFTNPELDGLNDQPGGHIFRSLIVGKTGPFISYNSHSSLSSLGPQVSILMLDCRAERKKDQVCSPEQYEKVFQRLEYLPPGTEHLVVQLGIPIAYPRMVFLENALESKMNPLTSLARSNSMGMSGFVNKFNAEPELLDDLNDHWTATNHKKERNWLVLKLAEFALAKRIRISFLSGDVHCAAVGVFKTLTQKKEPEVPPHMDHRYMLNVVTSAIVNTPPPAAVIGMVSSLATKIHKTLHAAQTDEISLPLFTHEPDGSARKSNKYIMGRRNWCAVDWDIRSGDLVYDIRVESEKGLGVTVGYPVRAPPPRF
ncbi:hypothetical protein CYLTODRAFT_419127 [Cylindrobasidium torrendii FP15055 ss-10]|uniref:PhoD-like phosphatase domain-containing protein n=1 Tax=Cylindrobasidium torrendii FP15055 ss-10 TaxID=1314674 RepID=A0A0D7BLU5_9AGAR|nr:hypothetical protein CYLTODRAFT_419127 [Cylindrobasidium torrendii FP15055 ss-10]